MKNFSKFVVRGLVVILAIIGGLQVSETVVQEFQKLSAVQMNIHKIGREIYYQQQSDDTRLDRIEKKLWPEEYASKQGAGGMGGGVLPFESEIISGTFSGNGSH